ncbi:MAG: dephospho-CoA kinase [Propionibacteriaceae bacterium]|jgi:dephospho-CoA kinase|nr:dephospho-CoA kinase [Propionibacteriaceae bacterium]
MIRVGLTGGIAAGKTVVSKRFEELGVPVVDYDQLARDVVGPDTEGLAAVVAEFGDSVLTGDGQLDRAKMSERVFADDAARDALEEIIHPLVIAEGQRLDAITGEAGEAMIVHDIPLLVEAAGPEAFDAVIVVDAAPQIRADRLVIERGYTAQEAWDRISAQIDDEVRLDAADVVFDGTGTVDDLRAQVDAWVEQVRREGVHYRPAQERTKFLVTEDGLG